MGRKMNLNKFSSKLSSNFNLELLGILISISFFSSFLIFIDGWGALTIPFILGSYLVYQFYEERQRVKYIAFFLPFLFLIIFLVGGGFYVKANQLTEHNFNGNNQNWLSALSGIGCAFLVLITVWAFFKGKLRIIQFVVLAVLIPIPYFIGLDPVHEYGKNFFFYFLWNSGLSLAFSNYFLPIAVKTVNE